MIRPSKGLNDFFSSPSSFFNLTFTVRNNPPPLTLTPSKWSAAPYQRTIAQRLVVSTPIHGSKHPGALPPVKNTYCFHERAHSFRRANYRRSAILLSDKKRPRAGEVSGPTVKAAEYTLCSVKSRQSSACSYTAQVSSPTQTSGNDCLRGLNP